MNKFSVIFPMVLLTIVVIGVMLLASRFFDWTVENDAKKRRKKVEESRRREFEELKEKYPEWANELNPEEEQEKKDRAEFERIARDHPDWL